jgi:hypothetical protein
VSEKLIDVFFYGLFMDPDLLRAKGLQPQKPRKASLHGFRLQLGERATLVRQQQATTFGIVMALTPAELADLFSEPSVAEFRAETVNAELVNGTLVSVLCYNLPGGISGRVNLDYAAKLRAVVEKMDLPVAYMRSIRALTLKRCREAE